MFLLWWLLNGEYGAETVSNICLVDVITFVYFDVEFLQRPETLDVSGLEIAINCDKSYMCYRVSIVQQSVDCKDISRFRAQGNRDRDISPPWTLQVLDLNSGHKVMAFPL
jgi:hypothetical protein